MAKFSNIKVSKPTAQSFTSWTFVLVAGLVLAVLAMIDSGALVDPASDNSTGCQLTVTAEEVNVRSAPSEQAEIVGSLSLGDVVDGTRTVVDGFRELEGDRFAADRFLTPLPGTNCA